MSQIDNPSLKEKLWHKMRQDILRFAPQHASTDLLMCCTCGRWLPQEYFDVDHLIPQQALKDDPIEVRLDPDTPKNVRAGTLLLCKKPLKLKGRSFYSNGCNSWKGKHYDGAIRLLLSGEFANMRHPSNPMIVAALSLGYLAMVAHYGYVVSLISSGLLMRRQFFNPSRFERGMPFMSQMVLSASALEFDAAAPIWRTPFTFEVEAGRCLVSARSFVVSLPLSRDPLQPVVTYLKLLPCKYALRPNFTALLD